MTPALAAEETDPRQITLGGQMLAALLWDDYTRDAIVHPDFIGSGACQDHPLDTFFAPEWVNPNYTRAYYQHAKDICAKCPIIVECRLWGIHHERWGVWGGLDHQERDEIRRAKRIVVKPV